MEGAPLLKGTRHHSANACILQKYTRLQFCLIALGVLFSTGLLVCVYVVRTTPYLNQYHIVSTYQTVPEVQAPRTILLWNSFFKNKRWGLPDDTLGPAYFRDDLKCPVHRCMLTNNHDFLPSIDAYDAIVFHTAEMFPIFHSVPAERSDRQLYVFALMEPPGETKHVLSDEGGFYNLTMTYRLDSDIVWYYQSFIDIESGETVAPAKHTTWRSPPAAWNDTAVLSLWENKTKTAAWFVSHCETLSKREKLCEALQKFIDVDIYGKCGSLSCPYLLQECDDMLDSTYKFYFSFENSLCTDYVTEKFFNALKRQVVPVVFGGADYSRFAPPHSYINAEDFESAHDLAAYLKYLSAHPEQYMRYFWWRSYYKIGHTSPFCKLCDMLHSPSFLHKRQSYQNIEQWWLGGSCRFQSKMKF